MRYKDGGHVGSSITGESVTYFRVNVGDFLDRAAFAGPAMSSSNHTSIRALTELLDILILRVHSKVGVERSERVSLHVGWIYSADLCRDRDGERCLCR